MQNFFKFSTKTSSKKAYKTLDNLFFIEEQGGYNLTKTMMVDVFLSVKDAFKIGKLAIMNDCQTPKEAEEFMRQIFEEGGAVKLCGMVQEFIISAMQTPQSDEDNKKKDNQETTI